MNAVGRKEMRLDSDVNESILGSGSLFDVSEALTIRMHSCGENVAKEAGIVGDIRITSKHLRCNADLRLIRVRARALRDTDSVTFRSIPGASCHSFLV